MVKSFGTTVRSRPTTAARSSISRRRALASSTGLTSLRNTLANALLTTRSTPFSNLSRTPMPPPSVHSAGWAAPRQGAVGYCRPYDALSTRRNVGRDALPSPVHRIRPNDVMRAIVQDLIPAVVMFCGTREWRNGRRAGFRCRCPQGRGGSSPPSRTQGTTPGRSFGRGYLASGVWRGSWRGQAELMPTTPGMGAPAIRGRTRGKAEGQARPGSAPSASVSSHPQVVPEGTISRAVTVWVVPVRPPSV